MASRNIEFPDVQELDPDQVVVRYDEESDTLFVHFYGVGQPGVSVQVGDHMFLRLDPQEEQVIGLHVEAFLRAATVREPSLLVLAQFADISPERMRDWRESESADSARRGFLNAVIHEWVDPEKIHQPN